MWNKIGELLGYPENSCELFKELFCFLAVILFTVMILSLILLPYGIITGLVDISHNFKGDGYIYGFFGLSFMLKFATHYFLESNTEWYPNLLRKTICFDIKWNKDE